MQTSPLSVPEARVSLPDVTPRQRFRSNTEPWILYRGHRGNGIRSLRLPAYDRLNNFLAYISIIKASTHNRKSARTSSARFSKSITPTMSNPRLTRRQKKELIFHFIARQNCSGNTILVEANDMAGRSEHSLDFEWLIQILRAILLDMDRDDPRGYLKHELLCCQSRWVGHPRPFQGDDSYRTIWRGRPDRRYQGYDVVERLEKELRDDRNRTEREAAGGYCSDHSSDCDG